MSRTLLLTLTAFAILIPACAGLNSAVRATLPLTYKVRKPANSQAQLGSVVGWRRVVMVNDCYGGKLAPEDASWSSVVTTYRRAGAGTIKADFGDAVEIEGASGAKVSGSVTLTNNSVLELADLFMLPTSTCATQDRERYLGKGAKDRVIVRSVRATDLNVTSSSASETKLKANIPIQNNPVHAGVEVTTEQSTALKGKNLFYAAQIVKTRTTLTEIKPVVLKIGQRTERLGPCWVLLSAVGDSTEGRRWTGELACEDGVERALSGKVGGTPAYRSTGEGVSYAITIADTPRTGEYLVSYSRWVVSR